MSHPPVLSLSYERTTHRICVQQFQFFALTINSSEHLPIIQLRRINIILSWVFCIITFLSKL